eukprot:2369349-Amphidinium_carterae.1
MPRESFSRKYLRLNEIGSCNAILTSRSTMARLNLISLLERHQLLGPHCQQLCLLHAARFGLSSKLRPRCWFPAICKDLALRCRWWTIRFPKCCQLEPLLQ